MRTYTIEPIQRAADAPTLYRLYVDGEPTVIAVHDEEVALVRRHGPNIERRALETLFKCSPTRKERLDRIPC
jgi:hypothetical protein